MNMSGMSRRDRALLAVVVMLLLYGFAALLFFMGRKDAWVKAQRDHQRAVQRLAGERQLVADREAWSDRLEHIQLQMPVIGEDKLATTHWKKIVEDIARPLSFHIVGYATDNKKEEDKEEDLGEVWELSLDIQYRSSLRRLVEFLYALDNSEVGLFDVRKLEISQRKPGELTGNLTLTCAYKKKGTSE